MMIYHTLSGRILTWNDPLDPPIQAFWETMVAAYQTQAEFLTTFNRIYGPTNPLLASTQGRITQASLDQPVFRALMDLTDRLGIAQGHIGSDGTEDLRDPLSDTWVPLAEAARQKDVTVPGLHGAIDRGDVIARPRKPGGSWLEVSQRSLERWTPDPVRQAARKQPVE